MRRVWMCSGIFAVLVAYSVICHIYVARSVDETVSLLSKAAETSSPNYAESAVQNWDGLIKKGGYVLVDLTLVADVSVSLSRVVTVANSADNENRLTEECEAAIVLMKKFLADNQNFFSRGVEK